MSNLPFVEDQPSRDAVLSIPSLHVAGHPLLAHKLTRLRDRACPPLQFAQLMREIGTLLAYPATQDLAVRDLAITTPLQTMTGAELADTIAIIPILRAGLGLADGLREVIPQAVVWHLGLKRDEQTLQPTAYYNPNMPDQPHPTGQTFACLIADPMLATGGSALAALDYLTARGFTKLRLIAVLAAPYGIARVAAAHPNVPLFVGAVDDRLNEQGYIVPGLGDAGDRQFGTI